MTKEELERLSVLNIELNRDLERLYELRSIISGRTSSLEELNQIIMDRVLKSIVEYAKLNAFVNNIDDPLLRQIILYRYVDGLQWRQIAARIGGNNTEDSVRNCVNRYLNSHKTS